MLVFDVQDDGKLSLVRFRGDILEGVETVLAGIPAAVQRTSVRFDCEHINYINTMGVGAFGRFMKNFGATRQLEFVRCPQSFIEHAMMVPSMVGGGRVTSLYVNFECPSCRRHRLKLVDRSVMKSHDLFPNEPCPGCSKPMHIMLDADALDERFLG